MASNGTDILIRILTAYEAGGMEAAKRAAEDLGKTIDDASEGGKTLSGIMDLMNGNAGAASQVFNGLSGVLRGGAGSASGMATAIKGIGSAIGIASGPLALLAGAVSLGITLWNKHKAAVEEATEAAKKAAEEQKKAAEEAAEAAEKAAEAARKALEETLAKAAEAAKSDIKGVSDGLKEARDEANALDDALAALEDAQLGYELAVLDEKMEQAESPEEKAALKRQKSDLKRNSEEKKTAREMQRLQSELDGMDETEAAAKGFVDAAQREIDDYVEGKLAEASQARNESASLAESIRRREGDAAFLPDVGPNSVEEMALVAEEDGRKKAEKLRTEAESIPPELQARLDAASKEYADLLAKNLLPRKITKLKMDTLSVKGQTSDLGYDAETREIDRDEKTERKKADEEAAKAKEDARKEREAARSPGSHYRAAGAQILPGQTLDGETYVGDAAGDTRELALSGLAETGRKMIAGNKADDSAAIADLLAFFDEIGARINNQDRLIRELQAGVEKARSQIKNGRT